GSVATLREALGQEPVHTQLESERAARILGVDASAGIGPAFQGSREPARLRREASGRAPPLAEHDRAALAALRASCSAKDWEHAGLDHTAPPLFGAFAGPDLAAVAGLRERGGGACDPCVLAHPAQRGRGLARGALGAAVAHALGEEKLVLYQTLLANGAALALARRLGFEAYAT